MKNSKPIETLVENALFDGTAPFDVADLEVKEAVRDMCAADRCNAYNHNWACPPACGSLNHFRTIFAQFSKGILVQTTAQLEDDFDIETMMEAETVHKQRTLDLLDDLKSNGYDSEDFLILAAGTCTVCSPCAYPNECRFPEKQLTSMEAAGLVVTEVCQLAGIPYNHGPQTIAYSGCILFN